MGMHVNACRNFAIVDCDIDLLIFSEQPEFELTQKISRDFFKQCEEKIDVLVINPKRMTKEQSIFVRSIHKEPLVLK